VALHGDRHGYLDGLRFRSDDTPLGRGGTGIAIREGRPVVLNDFPGTLATSPWQTAATRSGFAASASFPIRQGDRVVGALMVYAPEPGYFGPQEIALLEEATGDISFALRHLELDRRRQEAEAALRESEERFSRAFQVMPMGVAITRVADCRFLAVNRQFEALFGYPQAELLGRSGSNLGIWENADDQAQVSAQLDQGLPVHGYEAPVRRRDGSLGWVAYSGERFTLAGESLLLSGCLDITERKLTEQALVKSERFLLEAQAAGGVGCFGMDINLGIWESSATFDAMFGIDGEYPRDLPGWLDLVAPDAREAHRQQLLTLIQGQGRFALEFRIRRRQDGQERWVAGQGSLECDAQGQTTRLVGTMLDITERRKAEQRIRETDERIRAITDSTLDPILILDERGRISYWNPAASRLFGYSVAEALGRPLPGLILPPDPQDPGLAPFQAIGQAPAAGTTLELEACHRDGSRFPIELSMSALHLAGGWNAVGIIRDITERKAAEAEIRRMNEELERRVRERTAQLEAANQELEAFSYSVSHDLRAPLQSINGYSELLAEEHQDRLDEAGRKSLGRIRLSARRMGQLIEDLLKLSRISRSDLDYARIDLSALCRELLAGLAQAQPERRVEVAVQPGMQVRADARLLQVVLENLLGNAWKYTARGPAARIAAGARVGAGGETTVFIQDNGAGFDMAQAGRLFTAFQRLHSAAEFEGSGIGLATVQRIILRHGGRVWAEAEPGEGATFFFTLPG